MTDEAEHRWKPSQEMTKAYREHDWISAKVEIRPSTIHGKGMFAVAALVEGEVVTVWGGKFVGGNDAARARLAGKTVQQIGEDVFEIFDRDQPGLSYYQNHSCEPNTGMGDEVTIVALRTIPPGEELTIDYAMFEADDHVMSWECRCGTLACRKRITGGTGDHGNCRRAMATTFLRSSRGVLLGSRIRPGIDARPPSSDTPGADLHIKAV